MIRWTRCGVVVLLIAACGDDGVSGPAPGLPDAPRQGGNPDAGSPDATVVVGEPAGLVGITAAHNAVRAAVNTGSPLPALTWDPALAAYASQYLSGCPDTQPPAGLVDHNGARTNVAGYAYIGENIYASSGAASGTDAVETWAEEKANYDYGTNGCTGTCGHYTQIVWRTTTHVGCAIKNCAGLQYPSTVLCDYGPGGNSGGKPY